MNAFVPGERLRVPPSGRGPLAGLRFAVKDLIDVAGARTGGGNPDWLAAQAPARRHAASVAALLRAGAALEGKTITDELAYSLEGENHHYGTPLNPRWPDALPGGSSSGSASAVASGAVEFALGTDTGGSVRVPAAFCGLWGIRPSHGAISSDGVLPFAPGFDTVGWLARSGEVLAAVGDVLLPADTHAGEPAGPHAPRWPRRLVRVNEAFAIRAQTEPRDAAKLETLAVSLGARETVDLFGQHARGQWLACYQALQDADIEAALGAWLRSARPRFGPSIAPRFARLDTYDAAAAPHWRAVREALRAQLDALPGDTVLVMPTTPVALLPKYAPPETIARFYEDALTMNAIASLGGLPQVTLPLGDSDGATHPLALSLIGARGTDRALLALACGLEAQARALPLD